MPRKILSYYTHKCREDRISQRVWYENVTYPDLLREPFQKPPQPKPKIMPDVWYISSSIVRDWTQKKYGYKRLEEEISR